MATGVAALLCIWLTVTGFQTAHLQLPSLARVVGPLRTVNLRQTTGKNAHTYLIFSLLNHPQTFRIEYSSEVPLADLLQTMHRQQQAQPGTSLVVYYDPPTWWHSATTFDAYQVELPFEVVYSIDEIHHQALSQVALALLALFVSAVVGMNHYLFHRASAEEIS